MPLLLADSVLAVVGAGIDVSVFGRSLALQACATERFGVAGTSKLLQAGTAKNQRGNEEHPISAESALRIGLVHQIAANDTDITAHTQAARLGW